MCLAGACFLRVPPWVSYRARMTSGDKCPWSDRLEDLWLNLNLNLNLNLILCFLIQLFDHLYNLAPAPTQGESPGI
jgi:hypothetical protein